MDARWKEAIRQGDVKQIKDLLEGGSDIDARDRYGQTGLMLAAHAGHCQSVEILIAHGANLDITAKFGLSALMLAVIADIRRLPAFLLIQALISHSRERVLQDLQVKQPMILLWSGVCWADALT